MDVTSGQSAQENTAHLQRQLEELQRTRDAKQQEAEEARAQLAALAQKRDQLQAMARQLKALEEAKRMLPMYLSSVDDVQKQLSKQRLEEALGSLEPRDSDVADLVTQVSQAVDDSSEFDQEWSAMQQKKESLLQRQKEREYDEDEDSDAASLRVMDSVVDRLSTKQNRIKYETPLTRDIPIVPEDNLTDLEDALAFRLDQLDLVQSQINHLARRLVAHRQSLRVSDNIPRVSSTVPSTRASSVVAAPEVASSVQAASPPVRYHWRRHVNSTDVPSADKNEESAALDALIAQHQTNSSSWPRAEQDTKEVKFKTVQIDPKPQIFEPVEEEKDSDEDFDDEDSNEIAIKELLLEHLSGLVKQNADAPGFLIDLLSRLQSVQSDESRAKLLQLLEELPKNEEISEIEKPREEVNQNAEIVAALASDIKDLLRTTAQLTANTVLSRADLVILKMSVIEQCQLRGIRNVERLSLPLEQALLPFDGLDVSEAMSDIWSTILLTLVRTLNVALADVTYLLQHQRNPAWPVEEEDDEVVPEDEEIPLTAMEQDNEGKKWIDLTRSDETLDANNAENATESN